VILANETLQALDALDEKDIDEALKLYMVTCEEFHSGYSLLPANHSRTLPPFFFFF
jgi:hypothetical protein